MNSWYPICNQLEKISQMRHALMFQRAGITLSLNLIVDEAKGVRELYENISSKGTDG